ncbi:MAG: polysaccharide biosynthesis/export family protein [Elusimicrobiota bacterium]
MKSRFFPVALMAVAVLSACAAQRAQAPNESKTPTTRAAQAAAASAGAVEVDLSTILQSVKQSKASYKISPVDLLEITVYREESMDRTVRVGQKGLISFPLAGEIQVGGLSTIEAERLIAEKLSEFFVDPQITVFIKEYSNKQIYVLGEVKSPGAFDLPTEKRMTVLEAISKAGGFSPVAAKDRTKVIRATPDGKNISITIEVSAITSRGEKDKDIPLEPNDVIHIPQSFF